MRVLIPLADGLEEIEAVTVVDVLRRGGLEVATAAIGTDKRVSGAHGIFLLADALWDDVDADSFDAIVLPGGGHGTERLAADGRVVGAVRRFNDAGKFVAAICAAPTVLAGAGVLEGRTATCYPSCAEALGDSFKDVPVVADNNIITGQGPGTAMLFALVLIRHLAGDKAARRVADGLLTTL